MTQTLHFLFKSIFATLALPLLGAIIISSYSFMFTPSQGWSSIENKFFYFLAVFALFSIPTALNNSICYSVLSRLRLLTWWFYAIVCGLSLATFYALITVDLNFVETLKQMGVYGFLLGVGSALVFYWFFIKSKSKKKNTLLDTHAHYRLHLSFLTVMFVFCKLKLANYYPVAGTKVYLAVKPGLSFNSHLNTIPGEQQIILLRDEHVYIGQRYFEIIFDWGWWLAPVLLALVWVVSLRR